MKRFEQAIAGFCSLNTYFWQHVLNKNSISVFVLFPFPSPPFRLRNNMIKWKQERESIDHGMGNVRKIGQAIKHFLIVYCNRPWKSISPSRSIYKYVCIRTEHGAAGASDMFSILFFKIKEIPNARAACK